MHTDLHPIAKIFNETFAHWNIVLPAEALETRQRGEIRAAGWTIRYLFGTEQGSEYLDYYATHRMTNERHVRIWASGEVESLEAPLEFMVLPPNCSPEEENRISQQYYADNQRIYAELARKGFM